MSRQAAGSMYIANHNLNTEISLAGTSLLVPTTALINQTNAVKGTGSLGLMASKENFRSLGLFGGDLVHVHPFPILANPTHTINFTLRARGASLFEI